MSLVSAILNDKGAVEGRKEIHQRTLASAAASQVIGMLAVRDELEVWMCRDVGD